MIPLAGIINDYYQTNVLFYQRGVTLHFGQITEINYRSTDTQVFHRT